MKEIRTIVLHKRKNLNADYRAWHIATLFKSMARDGQHPIIRLRSSCMLQAELAAQENDEIKDILSISRFKVRRIPDNCKSLFQFRYYLDRRKHFTVQ
jgi:hypothetical protein